MQARGRHQVFLTVGKNPELLASGAVFQMNVADWTRVSVLERSPCAEQKEQTTHPCAHVPTQRHAHAPPGGGSPLSVSGAVEILMASLAKQHLARWF